MKYYLSDDYLINQKKEVIIVVKKSSALILALVLLFPPTLIYYRERALAKKLGCDLNQQQLTLKCNLVNNNINKGAFMSFMFFLLFALMLYCCLHFLILEIQSHINTLEKYEKAKAEEES